VLDELAFALDEKKPIVPVLLKKCRLPYRIRRLQHVDFTGDYEPALKQLLPNLGILLDSPKKAVRPTAKEKKAQKPAQVKRTPQAPQGMVLIPAGSFLMGSKDGHNNEKPEHEVALDAFYMDKYQVTVADYRKFLHANKNREKPDHWDEQLQYPKRPVVYVNWHDAQAYANWRGKKLPTEAQWEYAARGGFTGLNNKPKYNYPRGNDADPQEANFNHDNSRVWSWEAAKKYLKDVGSYAPNGYGLHDMAGNAWDWCVDWYDEEYYKNSPAKNPQGPNSGTFRVLRGGSWTYNPNVMRCADRDRIGPNGRDFYFGFRCVQDVTL
ncbi:MAG: formylglycine-generating enzyme family protein, partial [bacterium]